MRIDAPTSGATVNTGLYFTAHASVFDPQDLGSPRPDGFRWTLDGSPLNGPTDHAQRIEVAVSAAGSHTLTVTYEDADLFVGTSPPVTFNAVPAPPPVSVHTALTLACPTAVQVGQSAGIVGTITPAGPTGSVAVTVTAPDGTVVTDNASLSPGGSYSLSSQFGQTGTWTIAAHFPGDTNYGPSDATPCNVQVTSTPPATTVSLTCPTTPQFATQPFTCSGAVSPVVAGEVIRISYTAPDGTTTAHDVALQSGGTFSDQITPTADQTGTWTVQVSYAGDPTHGSATSAVAHVTVTPVPG